MKSFTQLFVAARAVSTPIVAVKTADATSTIATVRELVKDAPLASWDAVTGLRGLNKAGETEVASMLQEAGGVEQGATPALPLTLGVLRYAKAVESDLIVFLHNAQLQFASTDAQIIQGIVNLRDRYKASGSLLVLLITAGDVLPTELQQDVLVLEQPLPTRDELATIITDTFKAAGSKDASTEVIRQATDALVGLPAFPAEQSTAMCLEKETGKLDIEQLWARKRSIISQMPGLSFHQGRETLADVAGVEAVKTFGRLLMEGDFAPSLILRTDEIEKQFAGAGTDSSGSTGKLLGEFLTWIEDNKVICSLFLGVPGSSKSWITYCLGGEYKKPVINYSLSAMEDKHVGEGGKNLRNAQRCVESISDGRIWLIATANSLNGLPPELISRFQVGGIWFFDAPDAQECENIMELKVAKYGLGDQPFPEMSGWTGRDIENCARKAQLLGCSLLDAAKFVVPLMKSHYEQMEALRQSAHDRFLSASHTGVYQFTRQTDVAAPKRAAEPVLNAGRRIR
jgi:hypothetical protein